MIRVVIFHKEGQAVGQGPCRPYARVHGLLGLALVLLTAASGCRSRDALPQPSSKRYAEFLSAFYTGVAGLQVGDDVRAETGLAAAVLLAPGEPSAWADWGVLALRQRSYDQAADRLGHAHRLAPANAQIDTLLGLLESERGNSAAAIVQLQAAVAADPKNLRATYLLASEIERQGDASSEERFEQLMQQILVADPGNTAAELELSRVAAKRGDAPVLKDVVKRLKSQSGNWPPEVQQQLAQLEAAAAGPEPRGAATRSIFLRNVLMRVPSFRESLAALRPQPGEGAQPILHLLALQNPPSRPAAPDRGLTFAMQPVTTLPVNPAAAWSWAGAISLSGEGAPILAAASTRELRLTTGAVLPFPGGAGAAAHAVGPEGVLPIDLNYDFKTDLVLAGAGGVRLFRQDTPAAFTDVTSAARLPASVLNASYLGAWSLDIEADGDLDVLLGTSAGLPVLLRNNGDGTFLAEHPFAGISGLRQLVWVDLNGDGNPDAALLDGEGRLHIFLNRRSGVFTEVKDLALIGKVAAMAAGDLGGEGSLALVVVGGDGRVLRLVPQAGAAGPESMSWTAKEIARVSGGSDLLAGEVRLYCADFDNNGAVDLLLARVDGFDDAVTHGTTTNDPQGAVLWLQDGSGALRQGEQRVGASRVFAAADLKSDGRLALVELTNAGAVAVAENRGTKNYYWQTIRPRARQSSGDQRINSFGIGGEIEVRAGLLVQKQPITGPQLHFGLGDEKQVQVARILWPNGSVRAEFGLKADQQIVTEQRLKGSCPFLFAWDGKRMRFVKDSVPWGSAIGLRINALGAAKIAATEEWYKIGRDQLRARDGFYDLRVTGELWETYYYDSMQLMTVDHPAGTEVFTDERFDVPPVKLAITTVSEPQPVVRALDDRGHDVTATLARLDGEYVDTFGRGQYQGVTRDHYVEIELPQSIDLSHPLWLIAKGWLHPSDSSVNVALGQGGGEKPKWLSLEVADGKGGWRVARPNLGFPAGRNKICLIDLAGLFEDGTPHRVRLRTNLEIYWDQLAWAEGRPTVPVTVTRLQAATADLRYRGFSKIDQANPSSPEIPDYERLAGTSQRWRDLEGFYTRFGDVRALLTGVDDRYVIMNAGDEMALRFAAPPPPPHGWVRDFVLAGDGWIKDGDYNSTYSATVLPYPYHERRDYSSAPGRLEEDWVYRHHPEDWQTYQTRYVTAQRFARGLRDKAAQ